MDPVIVAVMYGHVALKGLPCASGCDYFLSISDRAVKGTKTHDENPPSKEGLAAYFTASEQRIKGALSAHFVDLDQVKEIINDLREEIGLQ
jgi:hypothetical protein